MVPATSATRQNIGSFTRVNIVPFQDPPANTVPSTFPKTAARTDCSGVACSYDEEMTNFANWYSYYRTRMAMAKTAIGRAFVGITDAFRVGFITINPGGDITNRFKAINAGRIVTAFVAGSQRVFDFVDDNPVVNFLGSDKTNDTAAIRKNPKVVAINSAIEIDLTGQVCADSMGHAIYSGIGGQMDFIRGAALSPGGKPIIALPSTARRGTVSRITPELKPGAGVVTTRGHVHWVVTEFGQVNLQGMTLRERAEALISIAHPDFRPELRRAANAIRRYHFA